MSTAAPRPADVAREALRAARARSGGGSGTEGEEDRPAPTGGAAEPPRPRSARAPRGAREARASERSPAPISAPRGSVRQTGGPAGRGSRVGDGSGAPVRTVAELLGRSFRMPPGVRTTDETPDANTEAASEEATRPRPDDLATGEPGESLPTTPERTPRPTAPTATGPDAQPDAKTGAGTGMETHGEVRQRPGREEHAETGGETRPGPDIQSDAETGAGTGTDTHGEARSHTGTETGPGTGPATRAGTGTAIRAGTGTETSPATGTETRAGTGATTPPAPAPAPAPASAALRVPGSMASPRRDGELRRTFPALPAPAPGDSGSAGTWWGEAWTTALEDGALDAARLARGRAYARTGHVDAITVTPGLVLAYVQGSRPRPYRVQVRLRTLDDAEWDRFLNAAAEQPAHIAALLDKEMPQSLTGCGVPLLPGPHDLEARCSCPDRGHPCKHGAALCYQTARLLDADPFVLLLLRGRGERELLDALSRRSAARAARAAQEREPEPLPGVRAADALARRPQPLPAPLPPPAHPEQPPVYPAAPGGPDPFALDQLATDAAVRAHALLTTGRDPVGGLTLWQDAVRLAAARPGSGLTAATRSLYAALASATGRTAAELARAVAAWRQGGAEGLAVLEEPWDPPAGRFDRARPLLLAADLPAFRPWRNRLTHPAGRLQLRLGKDHLWYAYESEPGRDDWWPRGTPDLDPVGALTGLDTPGDT
nr:SWIM zinc finger family protein [Streptomyces sp. NRRL S-340]